MQDNKPRTDIDGAFEDKAWKEMAAILDKEIPFQDDRKAIGWWLLRGLSLLLLLLLIATPFLFTENPFTNHVETSHTNKKELNANQPNNENKIFSRDKRTTPQSQENKSSTQTEKNQKKAPDREQQRLNEKQAKSVKSQQFIYAKKHLERNNTLDAKPHEQSLESHDFSLISATNIGSGQKESRSGVITVANSNSERTSLRERDNLSTTDGVLVDHSALTKNNDISDTNSFSDINRAVSKPTLINLLPLNYLELPVQKVTSNFQKPTIKKNRRWRLGLNASVGTFDWGRIGEIAGGISIKYRLRSRWNLSTGLQYHYFKLQDISLNNSSVTGISGGIDDETNEDFPDPNDPGPMAPTYPTGTSDPDLDPFGVVSANGLTVAGNVHFLSVPILLEYRLSRRLRASVGNHFYFGLEDSFQSFGTENQNRLRRFDIASSLGGSFAITKHWDIRFSYEAGWFTKRSELNNEETNRLDMDQDYSSLEGRFRLSSFWTF